MKDITIVILLAVIVILTGIIDATLSLDEQRKVDCLFEQAKEHSEEDWSLQDLYNPTGEWCWLNQEQPLPVDCQFHATLLGKEIE